MTTTAIISEQSDRYHTHAYDLLVSKMQERFASFTKGSPVFQTDAGYKLWDAYLNSFPVEDRQYHDCQACKSFIRRFGGLVVIKDDGSFKSAVWPKDASIGDYYCSGVEAMRKLVKKAKVVGVFLSRETVFGTPEGGGWTHFAVYNANRYTNGVVTPGQKMAEKREDYKTVRRALDEFSIASLTTMMQVINSDQLYRAENVQGPGKWLYDLKVRLSNEKVTKVKTNLLWLAVATAPAGFCHPRSSMIGTLLEDISSGQFSFEAIQSRFAQKMHPLNYKRPQAPPKDGNIAVAEKMVEKLGIKSSLRRRRAHEGDIKERLWQPKPVTNSEVADGSSTFGHLRGARKDRDRSSAIKIPPTVMTWDKFQRTVIPNADKIELYMSPIQAYPIVGLLTATDPAAPPIIKWDNPERRNPVSWYVYVGHNSPKQWGLESDTYAEVSSIIPSPSGWGGAKNEFSDNVVLVINSAKDTRTPQLCLFPEIINSELHGIRSVIEAHSQSSSPDPIEQDQVCGLMLRKETANAAWNYVLRVTSNGTQQSYRLDRWD